MGDMRTLSRWTLVLFLFRLFPAGSSAVANVTGYSGQPVQIRCSYNSGFEPHIKYLCRGKCPYLGTRDIPVESGTDAEDRRFSLEDDPAVRVFTITITDLRPEDGGKYWCGIRRPLGDDYSEVLLTVYTDPAVSHSTCSHPPIQTQPTDSPSSPSPDHPHSDTSSVLILRSTRDLGSTKETKESLVYINGGLVIVAIGLLVALLALYEHKKKASSSKAPAPELTPPNIMSATAKEDESIYQEVDERQQSLATKTKVDSLYCTAEEPTDAPIYSTIDEPPNLTIYSTIILH